MKVQIPSLGSTVEEILNKLYRDRGGYSLVAIVVGSGEWRFNESTCKWEKITWRGSIPIIDNIESAVFDTWLENQISKGYVSFVVQSPGKNPFYKLELHRATGKAIPLN